MTEFNETLLKLLSTKIDNNDNSIDDIAALYAEELMSQPNPDSVCVDMLKVIVPEEFL